ncbi:hypothetical protein RhiLY_03418 [Ceratobasidium sp. AG-Ba]|nr:hypothetical protein RhiLY_03418 [Ceratobasidium sp. AG-Ba]
MFLPTLAIASSFLKALFFAAVSRQELSACLTLATIDLSLYSAQLATYVGLSRSGLALPVGSFLPPPRPVTSTGLALYAAPVAIATWGPTVDAFSVLFESIPNAAALNSAVVHRTADIVLRQYKYYARLLTRTQPVLSVTSQQELVYDLYDGDLLSPFHGRVTHLLPRLLNQSTSVTHPPSADPESVYPRLSCYATIVQSATTSLGQCTPYRVLPTREDTVLATDNLDELVFEVDPATEALDRLEELEETTKDFVLYQAPPCTSDRCALVVYAKPSQAVLEEGIPVCVMFALWCYGWIVPFAVVWVFPLACWLVQWICYIVPAALGFSYRLLGSLFIAVVMHVVNVCVQLYIDTLVEPNINTQNVDHAPVFDTPSPASLPPPDHATSFDAAPILMSAPILALYPASDATVQVVEPEPAKKKRKQKKSKKTGAKVEDKSVQAVAPNTAEQEPAAPVGPPVDAPVIEPASIPLPEDGEDEDLLSSSVQAPNSPVAGPSQAPEEEDQDQGEGEWTTVVNRKPWRPFTPVPKTGANSKSGGGGRKGGRGGGKGGKK